MPNLQTPAEPPPNYRESTRNIYPVRSAHAAPFGIFPRLAAYRVEPERGATLILGHDRTPRRAGT